MRDLNQYTEREKAILWTTGAMVQLAELGLVTGPYTMTEEGSEQWHVLDLIYQPSDTRIAFALIHLVEIEDKDSAILLMIQFRDNREGLIERVKIETQK